MSAPPGRQYAGFSYPAAFEGTGPSNAYPYGNTASANANPLGHGFGSAVPPSPASGLTRRSTSQTVGSGGGGGAGGFNYFHQHTNSSGGHSAFGSESGSVTSSRAAAAMAAANAATGSPAAAHVTVGNDTPSRNNAGMGYYNTNTNNSSNNNSTSGGGGGGGPFRTTASVSSNGSQRVPGPFVQTSPSTTGMQFMEYNAPAPPAAVGVAASNPRSPAAPFYPGGVVNSAGPSAFETDTGNNNNNNNKPSAFVSPPPLRQNNSTGNSGAPPRQPFAQPSPASGESQFAAATAQSGGRSQPASTGMFGRLFGSMLRDLDGTDSTTLRAGDAPRPLYQTRFGFPDDDLPLLDELGINPKSIISEARVVLNPLGSTRVDPKDVTDLAGPLVFVVALAFLLSLQKKELQFSAIYGLCVVGLVFFKILLTLMSSNGVSIVFVMSALGYSLLPSLLLALLRTAVKLPNVLLPCALVVAVWSSWCATALLVKGLEMQKQRYLILYPVFLFYAVFATLTVF